MKQLVILLISIFFFCFNGTAQPFAIGHTTYQWTDSSRNNRSVPTEVYYPATNNGDNTPIASSTLLFPILSFGHGFVMTWDAYQNIWEALVPQGYIVAFPKTEGTFSPSHLEFGKDLAFVIQQLQSLNTTNTSIFYNKLSNTSALMGHSMGGGASFLAAQFIPNVTAVVNLAAAETNPSAVTASATFNKPLLLIAGANDCVTPVATNQLLLYNASISSCKTLLSINGGSHCQMANSNFFCNVGESSCTPAPTITRAQQHAKLNSYLIPWLNYYLKNDCNQGNTFDTSLQQDTSITFQKNCLLCNPLSNGEGHGFHKVKIYPNPAINICWIDMPEENTFEGFVFSIDGKLIKKLSGKGKTTIELSGLTVGMYIINLEQNGITLATEKIIIKN